MKSIKISEICRLESLRGTLGNAYDGRAVAKSTDGRENPNSQRRYSAPTIAGAFFMPVMRRYGGCAWARFGVAGFLCDRFLTLRTVASNRVRTVVGDSKHKGVLPMANQSQGAYTHTQISPSQISTALIGAKLIAYRVNRKPEQLHQLLGMARMACALNALSYQEHDQLLIELERLCVEEVGNA
ncbi:hypothetical protein [Vreelandella titanicae]|uniref:hypothetical protein n=1 Tax=Vreelandella titanicae TaxID=664683 RepID=UPI00114455B1|nr:hypothetical protein [Halomonas titanicae]